MLSKKTVVTIGTFDGVHKGHRMLIKKNLTAAKKHGLKSIIVALERPFRNVSGLLTLYKEKIHEISLLGIDEIYIIPVPSKILSDKPEVFFEGFLIRELNAAEIVCGADFAFGKDRKGSIEWLKKKTKGKGLQLTIVKPLKAGSKQISSSLARHLLEKGDLKGANRLLGRNYSFYGMPFREKGIAKKLGYPTVNLKTDENKLLPLGIFISTISQGTKIYPSITSIGSRPTFDRGAKIVPETYILDFKGTWKKAETKVVLLKKVRDEKKFKNAGELINQISKDVAAAKKYFKIV